MWHCLYNSLTEEAKATLLTYCKDYEIAINGEPDVVAPLMYKAIMRLTILDGKATITVLRANLHKLTQYAIKKNGTIDSIYTYSIITMPSSRPEVNPSTTSTQSYSRLSFKVSQMPLSMTI
jgi:hypothetical protein